MGSQIKQYLLGSLSKEESEKIDLEIILGSLSEEEYRLAESDLMEDYLENMLSPDEVELFRTNFLISEARESELKILTLLKSYAQRTARSENTNEIIAESSQNNFFQRIKKYITLNLRPAAAVVVFSILGLLISIFFYNSGRVNEIGELNNKDYSNLAEVKDLSSIILTPGVFREGGQASVLSTEKITEQVLLRIALPINVNFEGRFNVKILREQTEILTLDQIRSYKNQSVQEIRLILPSSLLKKGIYKIEIAPENSPSILITYPFEVR